MISLQFFRSLLRLKFKFEGSIQFLITNQTKNVSYLIRRKIVLLFALKRVTLRKYFKLQIDYQALSMKSKNVKAVSFEMCDYCGSYLWFRCKILWKLTIIIWSVGRIVAQQTFPLKQFDEYFGGDSLASFLLWSTLSDEVLSIHSSTNSVHDIRCDTLRSKVRVLCARSHYTQQHYWMHCGVVRWKFRANFRSFRWVLLDVSCCTSSSYSSKFWLLWNNYG